MVSKLLVDVGVACAQYQDKVLRNLPCKRIQCDEVWAFCYAKQKNVPDDKQGVFGYGDVWTWTALCADTKLIAAWMVGNRDAEAAKVFLDDLASRLKHRVQLTTDGQKAYLAAVEGVFGSSIDYGQLVKVYGEGPTQDKRRYSSSEFVTATRHKVAGKPDDKHISTSYVERSNLTFRMSSRRFTRLTNGFSKKVENHAHAVALHAMHYNFCRVHKALRVTPAMEAGIADHVWELKDILNIMDAAQAPKKRGPYKTRGRLAPSADSDNLV
jgi:IS1 family transposase